MAKLTDVDGVDGPFNRAMATAMSQDARIFKFEYAIPDGESQWRGSEQDGYHVVLRDGGSRLGTVKKIDRALWRFFPTPGSRGGKDGTTGTGGTRIGAVLDAAAQRAKAKPEEVAEAFDNLVTCRECKDDVERGPAERTGWTNVEVEGGKWEWICDRCWPKCAVPGCTNHSHRPTDRCHPHTVTGIEKAVLESYIGFLENKAQDAAEDPEAHGVGNDIDVSIPRGLLDRIYIKVCAALDSVTLDEGSE